MSKLRGAEAESAGVSLTIQPLNIESLLGRIETTDIWRVEAPWPAIVTEAGLVGIYQTARVDGGRIELRSGAMGG